VRWGVIVDEVSREELEELVNQHHWDGELEDSNPLGEGERGDLEDQGEEGRVEDNEVKSEGEEDGSQKVCVLPWGHRKQGLVLRHAVNSVQHLNCHKDGQGHGHRMGISEDLTVESFVHFVVRVTGHVV